ncbi:dTDP-4-dehydrorhamnose reductase [Paenibacillus sp. R14(2021)]|uniref:dTDP-4-dehydrorhamnose reductase n=1 Tax=Paenibacillus sp. R14(2021) TaxID=2859228 RepID=UPI001C615F90|nr:dTDP-4-dehydrorhamnose reductase [Paenibacillus sp. R14(2021)]
MDKRTIVVTGAQGQLGHDMVELLQALGFEVFGLGRQELDITDLERCAAVLTAINPEAIVHTAAYTQVDAAETDSEEAFRVNAFGTRNLAIVAERLGAKLVYVSTDYVFGGQGTLPYAEDQATQPINVYGSSKLAGETYVQEHCSRFFIARTSWVYGMHGNNFVKTMLKLAQERPVLSVVSDQIGCPTYSRDLAACIAEMLDTEKYGIYHVSNAGSCSWYEFAQAIFESAGVSVQVVPVTTEQFPRPAKRPAYSVFTHRALARNGFEPMRHWRLALDVFMLEMAAVKERS